MSYSALSFAVDSKLVFLLKPWLHVADFGVLEPSCKNYRASIWEVLGCRWPSLMSHGAPRTSYTESTNQTSASSKLYSVVGLLRAARTRPWHDLWSCGQSRGVGWCPVIDRMTQLACTDYYFISKKGLEPKACQPGPLICLPGPLILNRPNQHVNLWPSDPNFNSSIRS